MLPILLLTALAWETDPITGRDRALDDATKLADAEVDRLLDEAAALTNTRTRCEDKPVPRDRAHAVLARAIFHTTAHRSPVDDRGFWRSQGYGVFAAFLESDPRIDRRTWADRGDIFEGIAVGEAPILSVAGVCSTVRLAGVEVGTDKPDHFFHLGYSYLRIAKRTHDPDRAVAYGTRTENTYYGLMTSSTFSWADLHANWQGWRFYESLLTDESVMQADERGCVRRAAPFHWADWVDWRWDELFNPNAYRKAVVAFLDDHVTAAACPALDALRPQIVAHVPTALREDAPWAGDAAPDRAEALPLAQRCVDLPVLADATPPKKRPRNREARDR